MAGVEIHGWEVVMTGVAASLLATLGARGIRATSVAEGRYTFELPAGARPEPFVAELSAAGAALLSVSPLHTTLEEVFVQQVAKAGSARPGAL
jgi:hypothetical protein